MLVGNSSVPLLDVIRIPDSKYGEITSIDVYNPIYRRVAVNSIQDIEIQLASDSGEAISFDNSKGDVKTLVVLHFR